MDNSGTQGTNTTTQASPFAPVDIPDMNSIPAPSAMPPMSAMPPAGGAMDTAGMPNVVAQQLEEAMSAVNTPATQNVDTQQGASAGQDVKAPISSAPVASAATTTATASATPATPKPQSAAQFQVPPQKLKLRQHKLHRQRKLQRCRKRWRIRSRLKWLNQQ